MGAVEQAGVFRAVSGTNTDIFRATKAVFRALFIPTEKVLQVVHDQPTETKLLKMKEVNKVTEE
jgi:hypothetical protein